MLMDYLDRLSVQKLKIRITGSEANKLLKKAGLRTRWKIVGFPKLEFKTDKNYCTLPNKR